MHETDYDLVGACDSVSTLGLYHCLRNGGQGQVKLLLTSSVDGSVHEIDAAHSLSPTQCGFILAGSALNLLAKTST